MTYETTYSHFGGQMQKIIGAIAAEVTDLGGEVWEDNGDDYGWHLSIGEDARKDGLDVSLTLADAADYEGDERKGWGNVTLSIVRYGGEILGTITPYNYTPEVWVRLAPSGWPELQERLDGIEAAGGEIVGIIREHGPTGAKL